MSRLITPGSKRVVVMKGSSSSSSSASSSVPTYTPEQMECVSSWIEHVVEQPLSNAKDLHQSLKNGSVLCQLIGMLNGTRDMGPHREPTVPMRELENIASFMKSCKDFGVKCNWTVNALHRGADMNSVIHHLVQLSEKAKQNAIEQAVPDYSGPFLDFSSPLPTTFNMSYCHQLKAECAKTKPSPSTPSTSTTIATSATSDKIPASSETTPITPSPQDEKTNTSSSNNIEQHDNMHTPVKSSIHHQQHTEQQSSSPASPVTTTTTTGIRKKPTIMGRGGGSDSPIGSGGGGSSGCSGDSPRTVIVSSSRRASIALKSSPLSSGGSPLASSNSGSGGSAGSVGGSGMANNNSGSPVASSSSIAPRSRVILSKRPVKAVVAKPVLTPKEIESVQVDIGDDTSVNYHITQLKTTMNNASPEYLQSLASLIHQQDRDWVDQFVKNGGIKLLGEILNKNEASFKTAKQNTIQEYCIACLKAIADSDVYYGFIKNSKTVSSVALLLDIKLRSASHYTIKSKICELLALICTVSEDGFWCALDAMTAYKNTKKEAARFSDLVASLSSQFRSDAKVATAIGQIPLELKQDTQGYALLFINALINSAKDPETRAFVREEFSKLDTTKHVEQIQDEISRGIITSKLLISQAKSYEEEMQSALIDDEDLDSSSDAAEAEDDHEEDVSDESPTEDINPEDLLRSLKLKVGRAAGGTSTLGQILKYLLKLAQASKSDVVLSTSLKSISELMKHLVSRSMSKEEKGAIDDILGEIATLNKRIQQLEKDKQLAKTSDKVLDKLATEKNELVSEGNKLRLELNALKDQLQAQTQKYADLQAQLRTRELDLENSRKSDTEQVTTLKQELEKLRQDITEREKLAVQRFENEVISKVENQLAIIEKHTGDIPFDSLLSNDLNPFEKAISRISHTHFIVLDKSVQDALDKESKSSQDDEESAISSLKLEVRMLKQQRNTLMKKLEEGGGASSPEINNLRSEVEQLRKQLAAAQQASSATVPPPPPSSTGGSDSSSSTPPPPPPPGMDGSTPPPPPPPPGMGGPPPPPPPPGMGGPPPPPPPPGMGGPPPPPGMGPPPPGMMMGKSAGPSLPTLPSIGTPSKPMKNFYGDAIAKNKVADTIWVKGGIIEEIHSINIDVDEVEELFSNETTVKSTPTTDGSAKKAKKELVSFVEPQKSTNVALLLGYMRMTPQQIKDAIINMDEEKLSQANIEALKDKTPTADEIEQLVAYTGDYNLLAQTDQFYLEIKDIPKLNVRLNCWAFKFKFSNDVAQLLPDVDTLTLAVTEILESNRFKRFLSVVLAVTNFLNAKSAKKDAYGFKLKSLMKLADTKSSKNNMSLLQYIAVYCEKNEPELLELGKDIAHLEAATRVSLPDVVNEVKKLQTGVRLVEAEVKGDAPKDKFLQVMKSFLGDAQEKLTDLSSALINLEEQLTTLSTSYAEDATMVKNPTEFLQTLKKFFDLYHDAYKSYQRRMEVERKKQMQAAAEEKMKMQLADAMTRRKSVRISEVQEKSSNLKSALMTGDAFRDRRYSRMGGDVNRLPVTPFGASNLKKTGRNLS